MRVLEDCSMLKSSVSPAFFDCASSCRSYLGWDSGLRVFKIKVQGLEHLNVNARVTGCTIFCIMRAIVIAALSFSKTSEQQQK